MTDLSSGRTGAIALAATMALLIVSVALASGCGSGSSKHGPPRRSDAGWSFTRFKADADKDVLVAAAGDVNFGDGVTPSISSGGVDYPWSDASAVFLPADVAFVNLECCISSVGSPVSGKEFTFRGPADSAAGLPGAGIDVVSLANNHSKDLGTDAFLETLSHLKENNVAWCGAGNNASEAYSPAILERHGRKVAFVAFTSIVPDGWPATSETPGCATTWDTERVAGTIRSAKSGADYVVASFHWGIELATSPDEDQRELAHLAVDSGADLVIGHHPHVVQGLELYKNRLIAYSMGNFVFSPPHEISAKTLAVVALLAPGGLVQARIVPMVISNCRPVILNGSAADAWLGTVAGYSGELGTSIVVKDGRGYLSGSAVTPGTD